MKTTTNIKAGDNNKTKTNTTVSDSYVDLSHAWLEGSDGVPAPEPR